MDEQEKEVTRLLEADQILVHPRVALNEPIAALAHLGLARAKVLAGGTEKARAGYHDFLTLWKDAGSASLLAQAQDR